MDLKLLILFVVGIVVVFADGPNDAAPENDNHFDHEEDDNNFDHKENDSKSDHEESDNKFDHEKNDNTFEQEGRQVYVRYRRPVNLEIRVPFFQMYLRRKNTGPSNLGLQVFPDSQGYGLVNINHRWWGKK